MKIQRIEKLELLQKQNTCNHKFIISSIEEERGRWQYHVTIKATCMFCGKEIARDVTGSKVKDAVEFLEGLVKGEI